MTLIASSDTRLHQCLCVLYDRLADRESQCAAMVDLDSPFCSFCESRHVLMPSVVTQAVEVRAATLP